MLLETDGKCSQCGISEVYEVPVPLELHHKDGNHQNHDLKNLDLRCPNCHSQSENWCSKNTNSKHITDDKFICVLKSSSSRFEASTTLGVRAGKAFYERAAKLIEDNNINLPLQEPVQLEDWQIKEIIELLKSRIRTQEEIASQFQISNTVVSSINRGEHPKSPQNIEYPIRQPLYKRCGQPKNKSADDNKRGTKITNKCPSCGRPITAKASLCPKCSHKQLRVAERPSRKEFIDLLRNYPITKIAEHFGVSDTTIRKWLRQYKLPYQFHDIKRFFTDVNSNIFIDDNNDQSRFEEEVVLSYQDTQSLYRTAELLHTTANTVRKICKKHNIEIIDHQTKRSIMIIGTNIETSEQILFLSQYEARDYLLLEDQTRSAKGILTHIRQVINQVSNRKTAYGFCWRKATIQDLLDKQVKIYSPQTI